MNETVVNETIIDQTSNISIQETVVQYGAVLGKPVKWQKKVKVKIEGDDALQSLEIELPELAGNVSVKKIDAETGKEVELDEEENEVEIEPEQVVEEVEPRVVLTGGVIARFFNGLFDRFAGITGRAVDIIDGTDEVLVDVQEELTNNDEIVVEYYTDAPYAEEIIIDNKSKEIKIIGPDKVHYENVLAFSELLSNVKTKREVQLYWIVDAERQKVDFDVYDSNDDGSLDYIEWLVPSLSEQKYLIEIIEITDALHLDENRTFINNIYTEVMAQDNIWSERIDVEHYVRVTFETELDSSKDITVFARSTGNQSADVEVYEVDGTDIVATINGINDESTYKTYLSDLNGSQDVFDLRVVGQAVEFDHIVDPVIGEDLNISVSLNASSKENATADNLTGYVSIDNYSEEANLTFIYNWYKNGDLNATTLLTGNLVGYWPLNNDSFDYDSSYDGTASGATQNKSTYVVGGSYRFDGNDYITMGDNLDMAGAQAFSISAWFYMDSLPGDPYPIVAKGDIDPNDKDGSYSLHVISGPLIRFGLIDMATDGRIGRTSNYGLQAKKWYHIVATYNGGGSSTGIDIYIDGVAVDNGNYNEESFGSTANSNSHLWIGSGKFSLVTRYFIGVIDEVMIFNKALSSTEINQIYHGSVYGGKIMNSSQTADGDNWTFGVVGGNYTAWATESNSSSLEVLADSVPYFSTIPANATIGSGVGLAVNFTVVDESIKGFYVNDTTNFQINASGTLINSTELSVMTYFLNISVNDTFDKQNSTFYQVNVSLCPNAWIGTGTKANPCLVNSCGALSVANLYYNLSANQDNKAGICMNISANNITFGGAYSGSTRAIDGTSSTSDYGIWATNVYNINISKFTRIRQTEGAGIFLQNVSNSTIKEIPIWNGGILVTSSTNVHINDLTLTSDAIHLNNSHNNTLVNSVGDITDGRIALNDSSNNTIVGFDSGPVAGAYLLEGTSKGNTFMNCTTDILASSIRAILDSTGNSFTNYWIYNLSFGEIRWQSTNLTNIGALTFPSGTIDILNNSAEFSPGGNGNNYNLNSSANITLVGVDTAGFNISAVLKNGVACGDACYNFTALNLSVVKFNVSSFSNYSIGEGNNLPNVTSVTLNTTSVNNYTTDNLTGYVTATDTNNDNLTFWYNWYKNGVLNATTLITDNLVAYWPLNNDTLDYYGDYDGTNNGAVLNKTGYVVGGSYTFDGSSSYINLGAGDALDFQALNNYTLSGWVKTTDSDGIIMGRYRDGSLDTNVQMRVYNNFLYLYSRGNGGGVNTDQCDGTIIINDDKWHHLIYLRNSSGLYGFVDGVLDCIDDNIAANGSYSDDYWMAGSMDTVTPRLYLDGEIDELMIFNKSLNGSEIIQLYYGGAYGGNVMNSSRTTQGENWTLGVRAGDYLSWSGETNSSNVTILNSPPNTQLVVVNSTLGNDYTNENLRCYANITDADNTAVYANYSWYNDSVLYSNTESAALTSGTFNLISTIAYALTSVGENWTCSVKGYDGADYETDANNASIIITAGCGDGLRNAGEACEDSDFGSYTGTCTNYDSTYDSGSLTCTSSCTIDTSGCSTTPPPPPPPDDEVDDDEICTPSWSCTDWSTCMSRIQTRTCTDLNNCGVDIGKPSESQSCTTEEDEDYEQDPEEVPTDEDLVVFNPGCASEWKCAKWSVCQGDYTAEDLIYGRSVQGTQTSLCKDERDCRSSFMQSRECSFRVPVVVEVKDWCNQEYTEIKDLDGNILARLKSGEEGKEFLGISLSLVGQGYCEYCYDNEKNYDEEDIDCGGSCISCESKMDFLPARIKVSILKYWILFAIFLILLISSLSYTVWQVAIAVKTGEFSELLRKYRRWKKRGYDVSVLEHHLKSTK